MDRHANDDNDNDADTIVGRILVCAEFLIPSQTKKEIWYNVPTTKKSLYNGVGINK